MIYPPIHKYMEHASPTSIYFRSLPLLADHFKAQISIKEEGVTILLQPANYDIPMLLPYLFPAYALVNPMSAEQILAYLRSLPTTLSLPTKTLLVIDEHSSPLMVTLRPLLFTTHETHLSEPVLLAKDLPRNLSVCIILSRTLIEGHTSEAPLSILRQHHIHSIKTASINESVRSKTPYIIDLSCLGKRVIIEIMSRILAGNPHQEPLMKMGVRGLTHRDIQRFVSATNPISLSSALYNLVFYSHTRIPEVALPQLSSDTDTLYQLIRSFLAASLRDPRVDTTASRSSSLSYINLRLVRNLVSHIPSAHVFLLSSTRRLRTKRNLNQIYMEAVESGISPTIILAWLYDYIYAAYHTVEQIGHFCECASAVCSMSDRLPTYSSGFIVQVAWVVHELCVLKFTKERPLPQIMRRLSSFCPFRQSSVRCIDSLGAHEQYPGLCSNLSTLSLTAGHLEKQSAHSNNTNFNCSDESELTS